MYILGSLEQKIFSSVCIKDPFKYFRRIFIFKRWFWIYSFSCNVNIDAYLPFRFNEENNLDHPKLHVLHFTACYREDS